MKRPVRVGKEAQNAQILPRLDGENNINRQESVEKVKSKGVEARLGLHLSLSEKAKDTE